MLARVKLQKHMQQQRAKKAKLRSTMGQIVETIVEELSSGATAGVGESSGSGGQEEMEDEKVQELFR